MEEASIEPANISDWPMSSGWSEAVGSKPLIVRSISRSVLQPISSS